MAHPRRQHDRTPVLRVAVPGARDESELVHSRVPCPPTPRMHGPDVRTVQRRCRPALSRARMRCCIAGDRYTHMALCHRTVVVPSLSLEVCDEVGGVHPHDGRRDLGRHGHRVGEPAEPVDVVHPHVGAEQGAPLGGADVDGAAGRTRSGPGPPASGPTSSAGCPGRWSARRLRPAEAPISRSRTGRRGIQPAQHAPQERGTSGLVGLRRPPEALGQRLRVAQQGRDDLAAEGLLVGGATGRRPAQGRQPSRDRRRLTIEGEPVDGRHDAQPRQVAEPLRSRARGRRQRPASLDVPGHRVEDEGRGRRSGRHARTHAASEGRRGSARRRQSSGRMPTRLWPSVRT